MARFTPIVAPNLPVPHAFTTRAGGVSEGPFASLNLGLSSGDDALRVERNRDVVLEAFGRTREHVCAFHQVHGTTVAAGSPSWFDSDADAVVTDDPRVLLVVSVADCLPLLFHDPVRRVVAAAHCGWRGTVGGLAAETVRAMKQRHGSDPADIRVAIGPGISAERYQVGPEVVRAFDDAGFPSSVHRPDSDGRSLLDLAAANRASLESAGVSPERIWSSGLCTFDDASSFFSYRRDAGTTGRHWAVIALE